MVNYIRGWIKNQNAKRNAESLISNALDIKKHLEIYRKLCQYQKYEKNYVKISNFNEWETLVLQELEENFDKYKISSKNIKAYYSNLHHFYKLRATNIDCAHDKPYALISFILGVIISAKLDTIEVIHSFVESDRFWLVIGAGVIAFGLYIFISLWFHREVEMYLDLAAIIEEKTNEIKENKQIIVEDNDDSHKITTFNKIINDWGNKVEENKSYKIQNVKLNNITASLYIDYKIKSENEKTITTITFKHGDNELYTYTDKHNYFNLSFLSLHDNLIIYGIKNCDSIDNGICNKHLTYSQILAFNKDDIITIYNNAIITEGTGFTIYRNNSIFLEDEYIYAEPYNDFRVYDIKINNNDIYFYTIVEDYDNIFTKDYNFRDNNCDDPYWNTIRFDMQRTFKTNFKFDEEYKKYELDELVKLSSIKYEDYCTNKNVLEFNK